MNLLTKAEYDKLSPFNQGYAVYMQSNWPGSELAGLTNPHPKGSKEHEQWSRGELQATLDVIDGEE